MKPSSGLALAEETHPEATLLPVVLQEGLALMQLYVSVCFFLSFKSTCIYLCCFKVCVERPQAGSLCWGGGWQPPLCLVGGPAHGLSPGKCHFWAELEPRSCWEAVSVVGLLLAELHGCSTCRRGPGPLPKNHFQLKRSGNGWTRPKVKAVLGCRSGESRAGPGVRGSSEVRQGCPQDWWSQGPKEMLWVL